MTCPYDHRTCRVPRCALCPGSEAAMTPRAARELSHARRDAIELRDLLVDHALEELTLRQIMTGIGLATVTRDALMRAAAARETEKSP